LKEPAANPTCPRCGYDQSGAVAAWVESCPLEGVCSECGLGFAWVDVLRPDRNIVRGLYEHAPGFNVRWATITWWRALRPWSFWRWVPITVTPVVSQLIAWPMLVMAVLWAGASLVNNAAYGLFRWKSGSAPWTTAADHWYSLASDWFMPAAMWTRNYWAWDPLQWGTPLGGVLAMTLAWPLTMIILSDSMKRAKVKRAHVLRAASYSLAWLALVPLIRVLDGLVRMVALTPVSGPSGTLTAWMPSWIMFRWWWAPVALSALWVALWWWMALTRGFRIEKAGVVWVLLMIVSVLAGLVVLSLAGGMERILAAFVV
jgi:hypothetical protein